MFRRGTAGRVRPRLRRVRSSLSGLVESLYAGCFRWAGGVARNHAPVCDPAGAGPVLVVAPHPDDEVIGCGGTLPRHVAAGDRVRLVYVTDGRRSRSLRLPPARVALLRRHEAACAAAALGVAQWDWLGFAEGAWSVAEVAAGLRAVIEDAAPALIYAPSAVDFHPEHVRVATALAAALVDLPAPAPRLRVYQVQVPLTPRLTNLVVDVSGVQAVYQSALAAHASQAYSTARSARLRRYTAGYYGLPAAAEPFWEMSAAAYVQRFGAAATTPAGFRGLRHEPWTDGMAYAKGRRIRVLLAEVGARES